MHDVKQYRLDSWRRDDHDERDHVVTAPRKKIALPASCSLREKLEPIPIKDQKTLGSCTANAAVLLMEWLLILHPELTYEELARLFLYWFTRLIEGGIFQTRQDSGAQIRDAVKALAKYGVPPEKAWPYDVSKFAVKPPAKVIAAALLDEALEYRRIPSSLDDLKTNLFLATTGDPAAGPVDFGFDCFRQIQSAQCAKTGKIDPPKRNEQPIGGHSVVFTGYDDRSGYFEIRNSWSEKWGNGGYGALPYEYVDKRLASDFWIITKCGAAKNG